MDFLVVPTVDFRLLFVFVVLANERRRVVHFNLTEHPTSAWTAQQLTEAVPWDEAPRYLLRDRDGCYAGEFRGRARNMGIEEVLTAPHSPWQNPFVERLNGLSLDGDCPKPRQVHPPEMGKVVELPQVGGLHHRYERHAA